MFHISRSMFLSNCITYNNGNNNQQEQSTCQELPECGIGSGLVRLHSLVGLLMVVLTLVL